MAKAVSDASFTCRNNITPHCLLNALPLEEGLWKNASEEFKPKNIKEIAQLDVRSNDNEQLARWIVTNAVKTTMETGNVQRNISVPQSGHYSEQIGWDFGIEMRNRTFLHPGYFSTLARHDVAHVYNSWQGMPPVSEQLAMEGSRTNEDLVGARFLLTPGRKYKEAVDQFSPYERVKEPSQESRKAGGSMIKQAANSPGTRGFIYINNRLEGNALETIKAMLNEAT